MEPTTFVGLDVHKRMTSVAIAESGRGGEVRFLGEIPSTPEALHRLVEQHKTASAQKSAAPSPDGGYRLLHKLQSYTGSWPGERLFADRQAAIAKEHGGVERVSSSEYSAGCPGCRVQLIDDPQAAEVREVYRLLP